MRSRRINRALLIWLALVVPEHPDQVRPSEAKIIYKWFIILPSDSSVWHWFNKHWCISLWRRSAIFHFPDLLSLLSRLSVELWRFCGNMLPILDAYRTLPGKSRHFSEKILSLGPRMHKGFHKWAGSLIKFRQSAAIIREWIRGDVASAVMYNN